MKNIIFPCICLVFLLCCNEANAQEIQDKDVVGTWKINLDASQKLSKERNPEFKPISEYDKEIYESIRIEFGTGGIYKLLNSGNKNALGEEKGTWKLEGKNLIITTEEEESTLTIIGKGLQELTVFDTRSKSYWVFVSSPND